MMSFIISSADMTTTAGVTDHECFNGSSAHAFAASDITNGPGPVKLQDELIGQSLIWAVELQSQISMVIMQRKSSGSFRNNTDKPGKC